MRDFENVTTLKRANHNRRGSVEIRALIPGHPPQIDHDPPPAIVARRERNSAPLQHGQTRQQLVERSRERRRYEKALLAMSMRDFP